MQEEQLRSRVSWIVGLVLATAFVATIIWSVAQDADDDGDDAQGETTTTFGRSLPLEPDVSVILPDDLASTEPLHDGMYTLTVHDDGCGVIRTTLPEDPSNLTWVIKDQDGFQVLGRVAENEDRYRYFQGGRYTVVLEAYGGGYEEVSNTVTITC